LKAILYKEGSSFFFVEAPPTDVLNQLPVNEVMSSWIGWYFSFKSLPL
jgi:hypothetical protein